MPLRFLFVFSLVICSFSDPAHGDLFSAVCGLLNRHWETHRPTSYPVADQRIPLTTDQPIQRQVDRQLRAGLSTAERAAIARRAEEMIPLISVWLQSSAHTPEQILAELNRYEPLTERDRAIMNQVVRARFNPTIIARAIAELEIRTLSLAGLPLDHSQRLDRNNPSYRRAMEQAMEAIARSMGRNLVRSSEPGPGADFNSLLYNYQQGTGNFMLDNARAPGICAGGEHTIDGHFVQQFIDVLALGTADFDYVMSQAAAPHFTPRPNSLAASMWGMMYDSPLIGRDFNSIHTNLMYSQGTGALICSCGGILPSQ